MAQNSAQRAALIKKAVASPSKSEGMRTLLNAGMTVSEVKDAFGAPYGFVYGVAVRNGNVTSTPRVAKAKAAKAPAKAAAKAPARPAKAAARPAAKTPARSAKTTRRTPARARG